MSGSTHRRGDVSGASVDSATLGEPAATADPAAPAASGAPSKHGATAISPVLLQTLGMGLFFCWEIVLSPLEEMLSAGLGGGAGDEAGGAAFSIGTGLLLAALAVLGRDLDVPHERASSRLAILCGVAGIAAPCLLFASVGSGATGPVLWWAALVLRCVADAGLFLLWAVRLSRYGANIAWKAYAGSFALASALFLILGRSGQAVLLVSCALLPAASAALLLTPGRGATREPREQGAPSAWRFPWRPVLLMVAFSFAYRFAVSLGQGGQWADETGRLLIAAATLVYLLVDFDHMDEGVLYKLCPTLAVAGLLAGMLSRAGAVPAGP